MPIRHRLASLLLAAAAPEEFISFITTPKSFPFSSTPPANTAEVMALLESPSSRNPFAK